MQQGISFEFRNGCLETLRSNAAVYTLESDDAAVLGQMIRVLDGSRSLAEVADATQVPVDVIRESAQELYCSGFLAEANMSDVAIDSTLFYDHVCASALLWGEAVVETTNLEMPGPDQSWDWLVLGALIEHWHYARTGPARLMLAADNSRSASARRLWLELAAEEEIWARELEAGLQLAVAEELGRALPLRGTVMLCEQMRQAASTRDGAGQLGYAACVGAAAASEAASSGLLANFEFLSDRGTVPTPVLEPFLRYAEVARERGRRDPIRVLFADQPLLPAGTRRVVMRHVADHVHMIRLFHRDIVEFYRTAARVNVM